MSGGDVQDTLNELERKLRELQAELGTAAGAPPMPPYRSPPPPREEEAPPPPPPPPPAGARDDQLAELLRFRDQLAAAATQLVEDYSRLLEQITRATEGDASSGPAAPPQHAPAPTPAAGHVTFPVPPPSGPSTESTLYEGHVAVEAGPFADIAALAAFEAALRAVPGTEDVYVRSFEGHRAVVEVRLATAVPLVFELRRTSDQAFDVDHADAGRLVLAMHTGDLPFPMRP